MIKFLCFDKRDYELVQGFARVLERPQKHGENPLFGVGRPIRWRLQPTRARVYALWMPDGGTEISYHRFRSI